MSRSVCIRGHSGSAVMPLIQIERDSLSSLCVRQLFAPQAKLVLLVQLASAKISSPCTAINSIINTYHFHDDYFWIPVC